MENVSQHLASLLIKIICCILSAMLICLVLNTPVLQVRLLATWDCFAEDYGSFSGSLSQNAAECFSLSAYIIPLNKTFDCYNPQILQMGTWLRDWVLKVFKYQSNSPNPTEGTSAKERKIWSPCSPATQTTPFLQVPPFGISWCFRSPEHV